MSRDSTAHTKEHFSGEAYVVVAGVVRGCQYRAMVRVVPRAGAVAVRLLADRVGLTEGYRRRRFAEFIPLHDLGRLWVDVATMPTSSARSAK